MTSDYQSGASAMRRFRHKKRGTTYKVLGVGQIQSDVPLTDSEYVVIYQSEAHGHLWARRLSEFEDGRFEEIPDNPDRFASFHRLIDALDDAGILPADPASSEGADETWDQTKADFATALVNSEAVIAARDAEIATLRAALEPLAKMLGDPKQPAFATWADDRIVFSIGKDRHITVGNLRAALNLKAPTP